MADDFAPVAASSPAEGALVIVCFDGYAYVVVGEIDDPTARDIA
jgi:hypothetical protein